MTAKKPQLYLIDSFALAFRMFFAFQRNPLTSSRGVPTSVVFGYWNTILRLLRERDVTHVAIVKDMGKPTFRHEMHSEYKSHRKEMPEEMVEQLPVLESLSEISGIPVLGTEGYEADDLMATIARKARDEGADVYLVTKDKDMMQIVDDSIRLIQLGKAGEGPEIIGRAEVEAKFGVPPEQMRDLLALMGDSADNVPGVAKVGPKTASQLLNEYGTLEGVYENLHKITRKALHANLEKGKEEAFLSQELVTLVDVPDAPDLDHDLHSLRYHGLNTDAMREKFNELDLYSLVRHLDALGRSEASVAKDQVVVPEQDEPDYHLVTPDNLDEFLQDMQNWKSMALDTETSALDVLIADLVGLCLSASSEKGYYLPLGHKPPTGQGNEQENKQEQVNTINGNSANLDKGKVLSALQEWLDDENHHVVMHNAKFDLRILAQAGVTVQAQVSDTMIASYLLNSGSRQHSLDYLVQQHLGHEMIPIESLIGKGKGQRSFALLSVDEAWKYGAEDAVYTWRLWEILKPELESNDQMDLFSNLEMPLVRCLDEMETRGVRLDPARLDDLKSELKERLEQVRQEIIEHAGKEFNIASPKQLADVLFEDLGLTHGRKTKTGYSTNAAVLEELRDEHPIVPMVLEYRELNKLLNTYLEPLPKQIHSQTGRLHTSFSQTVAATGRLSSISPNLQNIPIRTEYGRKIRSAFVARDEDYLILAADYSQIELRVLAHLSDDAALIEAYRNGEDIHRQTAAAVFHVFPEMVDDRMRRQAKAVNFGVLYGMSAFRLARDFKISRREAQDFIEAYFDHYPGIKSYSEAVVAETAKNGFVQTLAGRRRYLPEINSSNGNERAMAERMALNSPVQGSAADIIKKAMILLDHEIRQSDLEIHMLLQVHDELVFEVRKDQVKDAAALIREVMETAWELKVPLLADTGWGESWLEAH